MHIEHFLLQLTRTRDPQSLCWRIDSSVLRCQKLIKLRVDCDLKFELISTSRSKFGPYNYCPKIIKSPTISLLAHTQPLLQTAGGSSIFLYLLKACTFFDLLSQSRSYNRLEMSIPPTKGERYRIFDLFQRFLLREARRLV